MEWLTVILLIISLALSLLTLIILLSFKNSIKKGILMKSLRVAFFGCLSGPDLIQSWELFSENKTDIALIERCLT